MKKVIGALIILYIITIVIFHLTYSYTTYWIDEEIIIGYTIIAFLLLLCCVCMLYTKWFQKILKRIFCWEIFSKIKLLLIQNQISLYSDNDSSYHFLHIFHLYS